MYDLEKVKESYPDAVWSAAIINGGAAVEMVAKGTGGGYVMEMPIALADREGLTNAARAMVTALRHKGYYPPIAHGAINA